MIGNNVEAQIAESEANEDYSSPKWCPAGIHLVGDYLVRLGQTNDPFNMNSLRGNFSVLQNDVGRQLSTSFHGGGCVDLNIFGSKEILDLQKKSVY